jgi:hypothetical protein|uniref:Uncharacterized protein n=1 Tax=viral metagenome TaxID=1070528 RepID=A0A6C0EDQ9_9ZZZZ
MIIQLFIIILIFVIIFLIYYFKLYELIKIFNISSQNNPIDPIQNQNQENLIRHIMNTANIYKSKNNINYDNSIFKNIINDDFDSNKIKNYLNLNNNIDYINLENIQSSVHGTENSCCLVNKKYIKNNDSLYQGKFEYEYDVLNNNECNLENYRLDSNRQLFFDNINNWSNSNCKKNNNYLGSCRNTNKECIDFVDKNFCDHYKMTWSNKTCHDKLDFIWTDRIPHMDNNILINNDKNNNNNSINKLF